MIKAAALIPAYNPSPVLTELVRELSEAGFASIIVVDDGSSAVCAPVFREVEKIKGTILLRHAINLGKGAALKTGLNHAYSHYADHLGVITLDADGQHLVRDALSVADVLSQRPESLVLGVRTLDPDAPLRSRIGNRVTRGLLHVLMGQKLTDTQSGLRGIPRSFIPVLLRILSNGYEFELDMLLACKYTGRPITEEAISSVYIDGNRSSHFNPVIDSMKIYFVLFRFTLASLASAAVDYSLFILIHSFSSSIAVSQASARTVSMVFNYGAVSRAVFYSDQADSRTFPKYLALVVVSGSISYVLIKVLAGYSPLSVIAAKACAESVVFLANFAIQRDFIFAGRNRTSNN